MTLRPLWRNAASSLAKLVAVPSGARLWYDPRDIEFLKEDRKDAAEILSTSAQTIKALVDAGYTPDAVVDAVDAGDLSRLTGQHSGLYSVQLQAPGSTEPAPAPEPVAPPAPPQLNITNQMPDVKVNFDGVSVPVTITSPDVFVNLPEFKAADVHVAAPEVTVNLPEPKVVAPTVKRIEHDEHGRIVAVHEEPA
jgi:hypothetical protein